MNSALISTSAPLAAISAAKMVAVGCNKSLSMPLSLLAKCKRENLHRISREWGAHIDENPWPPHPWPTEPAPPCDDRVPIGPGDVIHSASMHRRSARIPQAPLKVDRQPRANAFNVLVARVFEPLAGQIARLVAQVHVYVNLLVHSVIFSRFQSKFHSVFPVVDFVHGCTLSALAQQRNTEIHFETGLSL